MLDRVRRLVRLTEDIAQSLYPRPLPLVKPRVIQFPVNDICNSRCQMCNIWQQKLDRQISVDELDQILASPLFASVESVGLNGGEPTLRADLPQLAEVLFRRLPRLRGVGVITNAYLGEQVVQRLQAVGEVVASHQGKLDVMISLDGVGAVHDRVRGRPGNFVQVERVLDALRPSPLIHSWRFGCTVIRENVYHLHDLHEYAFRRGVYIKYRLGIPHQRLYSREVVDPFALTLAERSHFAIFLEQILRHYETGLQQQIFYRSLIGQLTYHQPRSAGCFWQHRGVTLSARGELLYCAVESRTLGDARHEDPERLYFDNADHLQSIVAERCASCTHDYMGQPPANALLRSYGRRAAERIGLNHLRNQPLFQPLRQVTRSIQQQRGLQARLKRYGLSTQAAPAMPAPPRVRRGTTAKPLRVLLCGWYGTETTGDKAILGGVIASLRAVLGPAEFSVASLEPYISEVTRQQMPDLADVATLDLATAHAQAATMDLVVFAGGPLMAIQALADMHALFDQAARHGVVTLVMGCGVGPLGTPALNQQIRAILDLASVRIYRDHRSAQLAAQLGVRPGHDAVAEDPALTWLQQLDLPAPVRHPCQLLLGLRDWPYHEYAPGVRQAAALKMRFEQEVRQALRELITRDPELRLLPLPMCTNHLGGDDRWFYRRWLHDAPDLWARVDPVLLGADQPPMQIAQVYRGATAALTMRFHATIFALSAQTPLVALDYTLGQGKVAALAQRHGLPSLALDQVRGSTLVALLRPLLDGTAPPQPLAPPTLTACLRGLLELA
ncbi:MAG: polysaccharide pyruvyl transferase family protein [Oscillochloridaceae bacterium umkhey_bin13]